jgi:hypothetical protein
MKFKRFPLLGGLLLPLIFSLAASATAGDTDTNKNGTFNEQTSRAAGSTKPMTPTDDFSGREGWPPSVSSINPKAGPGGVVVTLKGGYLEDTEQVLIGGKSATFTKVGSSIKATVPFDLGPGPVKVVVVVPGGVTAPMMFNVVL